MAAPLVNPYSDEFLQNPYPHYRKMRNTSPVLGLRGFKGTDWLLSRHDDICDVLRSNRFEVDNLPERLGQLAPHRDGDDLRRLSVGLAGWLFFLPVERHNRIRRVLSPAFSKTTAEAVAADVRGITDQLFAACHPDRPIDIISDIAVPLPFRLTCRFLGLDEADLTPFQHHAIQLFEIFRQPMGTKSYARIARSYVALADEFEALLEKSDMADPASLFGRLRSSLAQRDGLTKEDLISFLTMLLSVGQDTTQNLIGNSCHALALCPDACAEAARRIDDLDVVVDELARYDTPVQLVMRKATQDQVIGGQAIARGDRLYLFLGAALHDPSVFPDPQVINFDRERIGNLSFGAGIHFCLGSHLARVATRTVLEKILRVPQQSLSLATTAVHRIKQTHIRGLRELHLNLERGPDWQ